MHSAAETHPYCRIKDFQSVSKRLVFPSLPPTQEHFLRGENYLVLVDQTPEHMGGGGRAGDLTSLPFLFCSARAGTQGLTFAPARQAPPGSSALSPWIFSKLDHFVLCLGKPSPDPYVSNMGL